MFPRNFFESMHVHCTHSSGVLTRSKKTENDLVEGTLIVALAEQVEGAVLQWKPDQERHSHLGVEAEVCELKRYKIPARACGNSSPLPWLYHFPFSLRLSEDGNQVTLIQRDGTNSPTLIFLDDGPQKFINTLEEWVLLCTGWRSPRRPRFCLFLTEILLCLQHFAWAGGNQAKWAYLGSNGGNSKISVDKE